MGNHLEYISSGTTVEVNKARIREILDYHKKANMTSVLFQIRQSGTAYYQSSYEPCGYYAGYTYPGFDPLQYAIDEAHKRGLELHAWFNTFSVSSSQPGTIPVEHPEWICRDQNGIPMSSYKAASPGLQAVRDYTVNVAMEIVRNYDIADLRAVKKVNAPTDIMDDYNTIPEQYILSQNYPNPFNSSTTIKYTIPNVTLSASSRAESRDEGSRVQLKVYDVLGNKVATLVDEFKSAGIYEVEFNGHSDEGQNLSSGIYFYRLEAGYPSSGSEQSFVETKKMIYLK